MSGTIERLPGRLALPDLSDWAEAGFPVMDTVPTETHGIHVEERLTDGTYVLQAELPGIDAAKDVEITVAQGFLTLRAERSMESPDKRRSTRRYGHFTPLPAGAKDDEATAEYKHGVLTIKMPVLERKTGIITVRVRERPSPRHTRRPTQGTRTHPQREGHPPGADAPWQPQLEPGEPTRSQR